MSKKIVVIIGKDSSGKDYLATNIQKHLGEQKTQILSFNDYLYEFICNINAIKYDVLDANFKAHIKKRFGRDYLIRVAIELRSIDENVFTYELVERYDNVSNLVIPDCRFMVECNCIDNLCEYENVITDYIIINKKELLTYNKYDIPKLLKEVDTDNELGYINVYDINFDESQTKFVDGEIDRILKELDSKTNLRTNLKTK